MLPMKALRLGLGEALAADTATLAPAVTPNKIALVIANFSLTENLAIGDLTYATFAGGSAKAGVAGDQQAGVKPLTGDQAITILAPAGGWRWECTAAPTPIQVVYGFALANDAGDELLAAALLDTPIAIGDVGDFLDLGSVEITFVIQPMT